jgi:transcriptional regulator with XRE-family HTH domain
MDKVLIRRAFGLTIQNLRRRIGLGQEALARGAGVDRAYMGSLERGKHTPTLEMVLKCLPLLRVTFVEFAEEFEKTAKDGQRPAKRASSTRQKSPA